MMEFHSSKDSASNSFLDNSGAEVESGMPFDLRPSNTGVVDYVEVCSVSTDNEKKWVTL